MQLDHPLKRSQEFPIFFFQADSHSNHRPLNVANDNALPQQGLKHRATVSSDIDIHKIRLARDRRKPERCQSLHHLLHPSFIHRSTPRHMFVVTEGGKMEAESGCHDDHVMSLSLANLMLEETRSNVVITDEMYEEGI
jgi:hypothetical protein